MDFNLNSNSNSNSNASNLSEEAIAHYLTQTPEFFERHAETLARIVIASPHGSRAVSLHERQAQMLREKIKALELRIIDMVQNSTENTQIAKKVHEWACTLARVVEPRVLPQVVCDGIRTQFGVPEVALRVWGVSSQYEWDNFTQGASDDTRSFATSLTMPFCGPNLGFEPTAWLSPQSDIQSLALLPLREGAIDSTTPAFGMLVLGSPDPQRFDATMGTDFLTRMAELASAALARLR